MPRNGAGVYSLPSGNPVQTGTTISSTVQNNTTSDIATALTQSIAADGQTPVTADIPFNSHKATGLAVATTIGDALSYGQAATVSTLTSTATSTFSAGATMGNVTQAGTTVLDWYEEGSFTPTMAFGGGTTGITYGANRNGMFTRIGNRVFFSLRMQLTNKGSSVGSATISGLPYSMNSTLVEYAFGMGDYYNLSGLTGALIAVGISATGNILLVQEGAASTTAIADTNFTNTADLYISGSYPV